MKLTKHCLCITTFFSLIFFSCANDSTRLRDLLEETDKVRLEKFDDSDTLKCNVTDKTGIKIFTETIGGKQQDVHSSNSMGQIVFFSGGKVIFKASMTEDGIEYVFNNHIYREKITYRAGMYFGEVWDDLQIRHHL